ncbi:hypothetical protein [Streptomyces sp. NPDC101145]|uniref:hypothetical protein n=1 Tax=Streptomyces sp. NPDC101145 TaxID=3366112 RepID=UPI0037F879D4
MTAADRPSRPRLDHMTDDLDALYARLDAAERFARIFARLRGRCPACDTEALHLTKTGHIICLRVGCPEPARVSTLLKQQDAAGAEPATADRLLAALDAPAPASLRDQYATAISRVLLDSAGRLVPKHIAETAQAVQDTADAALAVRDAEMQQLRTRVAELEAALDRVRALHQPTPGAGFGPDDDPTPGAYGHIAQACTSCGTADEFAVRWPCPTIRALDGPARPEAAPEPAVHAGGDAEDCPACDLDRLPYPWICPGPQS